MKNCDSECFCFYSFKLFLSSLSSALKIVAKQLIELCSITLHLYYFIGEFYLIFVVSFPCFLFKPTSHPQLSFGVCDSQDLVAELSFLIKQLTYALSRVASSGSECFVIEMPPTIDPRATTQRRFLAFCFFRLLSSNLESLHPVTRRARKVPSKIEKLYF